MRLTRVPKDGAKREGKIGSKDGRGGERGPGDSRFGSRGLAIGVEERWEGFEGEQERRGREVVRVKSEKGWDGIAWRWEQRGEATDKAEKESRTRAQKKWGESEREKAPGKGEKR